MSSRISLFKEKSGGMITSFSGERSFPILSSICFFSSNSLSSSSNFFCASWFMYVCLMYHGTKANVNIPLFSYLSTSFIVWLVECVKGFGEITKKKIYKSPFYSSAMTVCSLKKMNIFSNQVLPTIAKSTKLGLPGLFFISASSVRGGGFWTRILVGFYRWAVFAFW